MRFITLTLATALTAGCVIHVDPDYDTSAHIENRTTHINGPITQVVAEVEVGSLFISGSFGTDATVDADLFYDWDSEPRLEVYAVGDTLYIELDCPNAGECHGDIFAQVPFDAFLDTTVDVGELAVSNTMGDWIGSVGVGNVQGSSLTGFWVDVVADTGNIDLSFDLEPNAVSAYLRIGDVNLSVPSGVYDVTTATHTGSVWMNGVVDDPMAPRELNATVSTGDIVVHGF